MVDELHGLRSDLGAALDGYVQALDTKSTPAAVGTMPALDRGTRLISKRIDRLQRRRQSLEKRTKKDKKRGASEAEVARLTALSLRVAEFEKAVRDALALSGAQRFQSLAALRERLQSKSRADLQNEEARQAGLPMFETQPTITTIVEHRPGPDSPASGQ